MQPNQPAIRPDTFDALVMQWVPFMLKLAARLEEKVEDRDDLVQQTITVALHRWAGYDPDTSFPGWLAFQMRSQWNALRTGRFRAGIRYAPRTGVSVSTFDESYAASVEPRQDSIIELAQIADKLKGRGGDIVMRLADGENGEVLAAEYGISRQRIERLAKRERDDLKKRLNTVRIADVKEAA